MGQRMFPLFSPAVRTDHSGSSRTVNLQGAAAVTVEINLTAITGTSITFTVQGRDSEGTWYPILAGAALTGTGRQSLTIGPATPTVTNVSQNRVLPLQMRLVPSGTISSVNYYATAILASALPH